MTALNQEVEKVIKALISLFETEEGHTFWFRDALKHKRNYRIIENRISCTFQHVFLVALLSVFRRESEKPPKPKILVSLDILFHILWSVCCKSEIGHDSIISPMKKTETCWLSGIISNMQRSGAGIEPLPCILQPFGKISGFY